MSAKFKIYKDTDTRYYFRLLNPAGDIILQSEGYVTGDKRDTAISMVKTSAACDERYQRSQSIRGTWFFTLRDVNTGIIGTSRMFETNAEMEAGINEVKFTAARAVILVETNSN